MMRGSLSMLMHDAIKAAPVLPNECVAHGLRKAALRRLADHSWIDHETNPGRFWTPHIVRNRAVYTAGG